METSLQACEATMLYNIPSALMLRIHNKKLLERELWKLNSRHFYSTYLDTPNFQQNIPS